MTKIERNGKNQGGFTMIEVVVTILILGIMSAFVAAKFLNLNTVDLNSETDVVKSHLRYAQSRAMNTNTVWGINISSASQYSLFQNGNTANVVLLPGQDSITVALPSGVTFSATGVVSFDTWGKPYTDAAATASQVGSRVITLTKGPSSLNVTITQNTGFIP